MHCVGQLMPGSGLRSWEARQVASTQSPRTPRAAWLMSGAEPTPLATARSLQTQEAGAQPVPTLLGATSGMGSGLQGALPLRELLMNSPVHMTAHHTMG